MKNLALPSAVLEDDKKAGDLIDTMKDFAQQLVFSKGKISDKGYKKYLEKKNFTNNQVNIILETTRNLAKLISANKDTIHTFILKNIYKPSTIGRFDILIGNPPWLSFRYIKNVQRQKALKGLTV